MFDVEFNVFVTDVCVFGETAAMNFFAKTGFHCL